MVHGMMGCFFEDSGRRRWFPQGSVRSSPETASGYARLMGILAAVLVLDDVLLCKAGPRSINKSMGTNHSAHSSDSPVPLL
jgi:hypothetical protein